MAYHPGRLFGNRRRALLAAILCHGVATTPVISQQVDLEEVMCTLCHFEQGDAFATSIHYKRGLILCNDCHGGLPFEADTELAKAPDTGFIGRPARGDIAALCGSCHSGAAQFFAQGPHHEWHNEANPTCISCHSNHAVVDATLDLIDDSCSKCHEVGTPALAWGADLAAALRGAKGDLDHAATILDSLIASDRSLRHAMPLLEAARSSLREADPRSHALDQALMNETFDLFRQDLTAVERAIADHTETRERRRWIVYPVWGFIVVNVLLMWVKRRQLK